MITNVKTTLDLGRTKASLEHTSWAVQDTPIILEFKDGCETPIEVQLSKAQAVVLSDQITKLMKVHDYEDDVS